MTNGDKIRAMTDEELAAKFPHDWCVRNVAICSGISGVEGREFNLTCYECRVAWLKQEVSKDATD